MDRHCALPSWQIWILQLWSLNLPGKLPCCSHDQLWNAANIIKGSMLGETLISSWAFQPTLSRIQSFRGIKTHFPKEKFGNFFVWVNDRHKGIWANIWLLTTMSGFSYFRVNSYWTIIPKWTSSLSPMREGMGTHRKSFFPKLFTCIQGDEAMHLCW